MASPSTPPAVRLPAIREDALRPFARLAAQALRAPVALLCAGGPGAVRPVASCGAPEPWGEGWEDALAALLLRRLGAAEEAATARLRAGARFPGAGGCAVARVPGPGGVPRGVLAVLDLRPRAWRDDELELLRELAAAAGGVLAPAAGAGGGREAAAGARWRRHWLAGGAGGAVQLPGGPADELSALRVRYAAAAAALEGDGLEDVFRRALAGVCGHAGCAAGRALLWGRGPPSEWWHLAAGGPAAAGLRPAADTALAERARTSGEPAWAPEGEAALPPLLRALGARCALALPVRAGGEVAAVLELFPAEASPPGPWLAGALEDAAGHLGRRLERERGAEEPRRAERDQLLAAEQAARARAERAERRSAVLAYSSELLHDAFDYADGDLRATLSGLASLAVPTLADYCRIDEALPDGSLRPVTLVRRRPRGDDDAAPFPAGADPSVHPAVHAVRTGRSVLLPEASPAELRRLFGPAERRRLPARLRSLVVVPLAARGRTFGALTLATAGSGRHYEHDDLHFAGDLARRIALALDNVRLYREAGEAARLRDDVLAIVSHDLRNPLNVVTFSADVLLRSGPEGADDAFRLRQLQGIAQAAERMRRLILDLLDVARVEAGGLPVDPAPCPAGPLVAHALELDAALAQEKAVEMRSLVCCDAPLVMADRERVLQVLSNLLGNAVRFTPAGGSITVRAEPAGRDLRFSVADTGAGIPPEHLPHVFDRFWRGQRFSRSGTGLGLAIARGIVEAHGGRIWAESTVGEGSTFHFTLPRAGAG